METTFYIIVKIVNYYRACVYGGGEMSKQKELLKQGVQIVIATPGRLNDLVERGLLDVSAVTYLV